MVEAGQQPPSAQVTSALVYDDHVDIARLLQFRLNQLGIDASYAIDRPQFVAALERGTPNFIFLDLALGATDAVEILDLLKEKGYTGRIVLMSGAFTLALEHVSRIGSRAGLDIAGILKKPFHYRELQELLGGLLAPPPPREVLVAEQEHEITLGDGLANNWVEFWYQPKIELVSGALVGAEALVRLRHPELGVQRPGSLLKRATGEQLAELLVRALDDVARNSLKLQRQGIPLSFSVNVAGCTLAEPELIDRLKERRAAVGPDASIILEITETDFVDDRFAAETFVTRALLHGFEVSIDDFGHGYATFERLRGMPFTELKLERTMVDGCARDRALEHICRAAARLGHDFGAKVVAEGIEREADLALVRSLGFDMAQGYLFSRALPFEDFARLPRSFTLEQPNGRRRSV